MSKQYCYEFYVQTKKRIGDNLVDLDLSILDSLFNKYFSSYSIEARLVLWWKKL